MFDHAQPVPTPKSESESSSDKTVNIPISRKAVAEGALFARLHNVLQEKGVVQEKQTGGKDLRDIVQAAIKTEKRLTTKELDLIVVKLALITRMRLDCAEATVEKKKADESVSVFSIELKKQTEVLLTLEQELDGARRAHFEASEAAARSFFSGEKKVGRLEQIMQSLKMRFDAEQHKFGVLKRNYESKMQEQLSVTKKVEYTIKELDETTRMLKDLGVEDIDGAITELEKEGLVG